MEGGTKIDQAQAATLTSWLEAALPQRTQQFGDYQGVFLTAKGEPRKQLPTKGVAESYPAAAAALAIEQERVVRVAERLRSAKTLARTTALLTVANVVIETYEELKAHAAQLDFDDHIECTVTLFARPGIAPWVLYKLDGGLHHLLLDEAQDTSPIQWQVIAALVEEFLAGDGSSGVSQRTVFVVGDEKQSIYSFQGADLATFARLRHDLAKRATTAQRHWREETLDLSFRSTEAVLTVVDAVFADHDAHQGVALDGAGIEHRTIRKGQAGIVELWPLAESLEPREPPPPWAPPTERQHQDDPPRRVARAIAGRIKSWIDDRTLLESAARPIEPADILILLPRRGSFQEEMIRALKRAQVPVAGTDRMALTEQIAVMDLMALGDVLLLPEDDLSLACVLKSPLFGLSEDDLFALAYGRGATSLFEQLRRRRSDKEIFAKAYDRLSGLMARADFMPPFELYAELLGAGGGRRRLLQRLGPDAAEPIEAFLAQALAFERGHPSSLQSFLHWLRIDVTTLKRDPEQARDEVRVMTVHGAKGLEAPIVFLPDTTYLPDLRHERLIWLSDDELPLWKAAGADRDTRSAVAVEAARQRKLEEHRRLLYVALTRARDRLIVCGWKPKNPPREPCWYDYVQRGLQALEETDIIDVDAGSGIRGTGLRIAMRQSAPAPPAQDAIGADEPMAPPAWLAQPAGEERLVDRSRPSRLADEEPPSSSPLGDDGGRAMLHGRLVHKLLQMLPSLPPDRRNEAVWRFLRRTTLAALGETEREDIAAQVNSILETPALAELFGPRARAEQPIAGVVGGRLISGQIDRLLVGADTVVVADFKTGRQPPASARAVPVAYVRQMAAYRALLQPIYPDHSVQCHLVWTVGPTIVRLDDTLLDAQIPISPVTHDSELPTSGEA